MATCEFLSFQDSNFQHDSLRRATGILATLMCNTAITDRSLLPSTQKHAFCCAEVPAFSETVRMVLSSYPSSLAARTSSESSTLGPR